MPGCEVVVAASVGLGGCLVWGVCWANVASIVACGPAAYVAISGNVFGVSPVPTHESVDDWDSFE